MDNSPNWVAWWGAILSTGLAIWEWHKRRRAGRPKLAAFISQPVMGELLEGQGVLDDSGQTREIQLHNRGGAATTLRKYRLCVAPTWCPRWLLGPLGEFGLAPIASGGPHELGFLNDRPVEMEAQGEVTIRVVLWAVDRQAFRDDRLMLLVVDSWNRVRPQQIPVHQSK